MQPLVSIIVPLYNQAAYVAETLESILHQTYRHWECIIVDDGSTDDSLQVAIAKANNHPQVQIHSIENKGVAAARNFGVNVAKGEWIVCLDADDYIATNYLQEIVACIQVNKNAKVIVPKGVFVGEKTGDIPLAPYSLQNIAKQCPFHVSAAFTRSGFQEIGGFDESMRTGLEDWEFWIHLLKNGALVTFCATTTFYYRIKPSSRNISFSSGQRLEIYNYISTKHAQFFAENLGGSLMYYKMYTDAAAKVAMVEKWLPKKWLGKLRKWVN